jgi:hypothetical protein
MINQPPTPHDGSVTQPMTSYQPAEKRPSAAFPSSFVVAAYNQVRLIPQGYSGALHLGIFEQPAKNEFFSNLPMLSTGSPPWERT